MVFSCESCGIFKNTYFVEYQRMAASAINIDAKYSHPSQQVNTYKQCWETRLSVTMEMSG